MRNLLMGQLHKLYWFRMMAYWVFTNSNIDFNKQIETFTIGICATFYICCVYI